MIMLGLILGIFFFMNSLATLKVLAFVLVSGSYEMNLLYRLFAATFRPPPFYPSANLTPDFFI